MMHVNSNRLVDNFIKLIKIDSESGNELEVAIEIESQLQQLGFDVERLAVPENLSNGFNIYAKLQGKLDDSVVLSCHMDTVAPGKAIEPIIENGIIRSAGDTILGGDDKSGIAAIIEAVKTIQQQNIEHKTIEIAFTVFEEGGLRGSKQFDINKIESRNGIVLDTGGPIGTIITVAPGQQNIKVNITGKPAHAGLAPEQGINALTVAADAISNMKLSRIDSETTANIGIVKGGHATNVVMPTLYLEAEARSIDEQKLAIQVAHMVETFEAAAEKHGAEISIETSRAYNPFQLDCSHPHIVAMQQAFTDLDIEPRLAATGGGSDANVFSEKGLTIANVSTGMSKVHTTEEFIAIEDMQKVSEFLVCYLRSGSVVL
ncbi:M20/M25/M40 family metallo-hydrolase [Vibrio gallicus]|uniref:M20/M25/M40 family metallo-hydrolase n=1 Tax=Vibrio gallicus TaxID=190897 RepID=UPI0021C38185|nr:M20/M25/M40 family metallo-hydrolase [Vibrio gallicus]